MSDEHEDEEHARARRRTHLIALVAVAALVLGGIWLAHVLGAASKLQDCVMSGRSNCVRFN
jgi:hypothetical protein